MAAEFTSEGFLTAVGHQTSGNEARFSGVGTLTASAPVVAITGAVAEFSAEGQLIADGGAPDVDPPESALSILDPALTQAPTAVVVFLTDLNPSQDVVFSIDGEVVLTATADSEGNLGPLSVPVPESVGAAGSHTITATQDGSAVASGTFTLARDPNLGLTVRGPDAAPVDVPASVIDGKRHWVLQDLMPGGLGSYVMPWNPAKMTSPHFERPLDGRHTTSSSGQFHVYEGGPAPVEWQFSGYCTQEIHDQLLAFWGLNRRFYVIDHRGRAWKVTFTSVDVEARLREAPNGVTTDWGHDYTVTALIYDQDWSTPEVTP